MTFLQITSPTDGEKMYIDICATGDQEHKVTCVLSEKDMIGMIMCRLKGIPGDDWGDLLNGIELIEYELRAVFGIAGDVEDLACKVHDHMKETDRKAVREKMAVVGAMV